ncbi:MAG TPA: FAD-dependent oxidoreductase [Archangium sp.]|uniref:FAD-dependent oxidoreductase n=1 Tax=Archangium sp. TaxID=1872627 RepID=UPI002E343C7A|nr:FAD-dependent oxidoreductase [Archangium sp.]HEX5754667.1 FAD-dependent oxidoreductase [Archangium sp.]
MRLKHLSGALAICLTLLVAVPAPARAQSEELWLESRSSGTLQSQTALQAGKAYRLTLQGTFSLWPDIANPSRLGGEPERAPRFPSPGGAANKQVGLDPEFVFAWPVGASHDRTSEPSPRRQDLIQISLDGGRTWRHPATPAPYAMGSHEYHYPLTGAGQPLQLRVTGGSHSSSYGRLKATLQPATREAPVIIVGAGLTGLTLAYELKKAGIDALLIEASSRAGGRIQTVTFSDGATAEAHMEEYFARSPAVALLRELKLPLLEDVAHSSVRIDGKLYPYQGGGERDTYLAGIFDAQERAAFIAWHKKAWELYTRLHASHYEGKPLPADLAALMSISFADFVKRDNLPRKVSEWIRVTVEPEMAIEWDKISALDGIDEIRLFLDTPEGFGEKNYHVAGGNTQFVETLAARLEPSQFMLNARVTAIEQSDAGVKLRVLENDRQYIDVTGRLVAVTVPVHHLGRIQFTPSLDAETWKAINTTRMGSYIKVHFRMAPDSSSLWTVNNENLLTLLSDTQAGSIYDVTDLQASGQGTREQVVTLLLHARFARELMGKSLNEVHDKSAEALEQLFPGARQRIRSSEIFVYPSAVAYWPLELGRSRFDALANVLRRPHGRLLIGGDTTEDSHSEGAVVAALRMKRQILGLMPSLVLGCGRKVRLKSWKGDYLQRPEQPQGVTTLASGAGTDWLVECQCSEEKFLFKSSKGDYLSRPDTAQGVSSASSGPGTEWAFESDGNKVRLRSWKGDYLHRPDTAQGVSTWPGGVTGNDWLVEAVP